MPNMILPNGQIAMSKTKYEGLKETVMKEWFYGLPAEQMWKDLQEHLHITEDDEGDEIEY